MASSSNSCELRSAATVRQQLGKISNVTLWRWTRDPDLNFPKPRKIQGRNYFRADEIDAWIEAQAASPSSDQIADRDRHDDGDGSEDDDADDGEPP